MGFYPLCGVVKFVVRFGDEDGNINENLELNRRMDRFCGMGLWDIRLFVYLFIYSSQDVMLNRGLK